MTTSNKKNLLRLTIIAVITFSLMIPAVSFAQTSTYTPLEPLPCIQGGGVDCKGATDNSGGVNFQNYVQYMFNLAIFLAAAAAVFMIVWGGFKYMTTDSWQGKNEGLGYVKNALLGLLLVLTSYLLLRTIDPRLVAIPTTLVKPLNINYTSTSDAFLNQLQTQSQIDSAYKNNMTSVVNNIQAANTSISSLNSQITAAENRICASGGGLCTDPTAASTFCSDATANDAIYADCQTLNKAQSSLTSAQSTVSFNKAQGEMMASIQQCAFGDSACLANNNTSITSIFSQYSSQLQPDQKPLLSAYEVYSANFLDLSKQYSNTDMTNPSQTVQNLNSALASMTLATNKYSTAPGADPTIAAQMQAQLKSTTALVSDRVKTLNQYGNKICTGMSCK